MVYTLPLSEMSQLIVSNNLRSNTQAAPLVMPRRALQMANIFGDAPAGKRKTVCNLMRYPSLVLSCKQNKKGWKGWYYWMHKNTLHSAFFARKCSKALFRLGMLSGKIPSFCSPVFVCAFGRCTFYASLSLLLVLLLLVLQTAFKTSF